MLPWCCESFRVSSNAPAILLQILTMQTCTIYSIACPSSTLSTEVLMETNNTFELSLAQSGSWYSPSIEYIKRRLSIPRN